MLLKPIAALLAPSTNTYGDDQRSSIGVRVPGAYKSRNEPFANACLVPRFVATPFPGFG